MVEQAAVFVNLIPYFLAVIILIIGIFKHKKARNKIAWIFPLTAFQPIPIITLTYIYITKFSTARENVLSLLLLLVGYLIMDLAFYIAMQPTEYNHGFYISLIPLSIGALVCAAGLVIMQVKI